MDPLKIIQKYYDPKSVSYYFLVKHSESVAKKAVEIAKRLKNPDIDLKFIEEAAMLHDIGIFLTDKPEIGCYGNKPYICHGYLGREILEKEGLPKHGLVCERHILTGLTAQDIKEQNLPLPKRDMVPISIEEQIICFADKFFSKNEEFLTKEEPIEKIRRDIMRFGGDKVKVFDKWLKEFQ